MRKPRIKQNHDLTCRSAVGLVMCFLRLVSYFRYDPLRETFFNSLDTSLVSQNTGDQPAGHRLLWRLVKGQQTYALTQHTRKEGTHD
jgi:hypothetical protein